MPATVIVNFRTVVHKGSVGISTSLPDACKTPAPPGPPVPIPYPNIARSTDTAKGSTKVKCDGKPIMLKNSEFSRSNGDEAGTLKGLASNVNMGKAKFALYSFDVKVEGKNVPRLGDPMTTNGNGSNSGTIAVGQPNLTAVEAQIKADLCKAFCKAVEESKKKKKKGKKRNLSYELEQKLAGQPKWKKKGVTFAGQTSLSGASSGRFSVPGFKGATIPDAVLCTGTPPKPRRCFDFKFPGDRWRGSQKARQRKLAGGRKPVEISVKSCGC